MNQTVSSSSPSSNSSSASSLTPPGGGTGNPIGGRQHQIEPIEESNLYQESKSSSQHSNNDDEEILGLVNGGTTREPDSDAIKMFVGQIPRNMSEAELKAMFQEYGPVYQLNILRDKQSGESKGCCFVTFYARKSALDAQNAMHNLRTLSGMHHPIQMKPADTENRNERKLFIGMISRSCEENDIRVMFSPYGQIEDCTVLRDSNLKSRGCAFVTYLKRQSAINAIKSMHHSQTMEGCSSPVVVKFADTPRDKESKKMHQINGGLLQQFLTTNNNTTMNGNQQQQQRPVSFQNTNSQQINNNVTSAYIAQSLQFNNNNNQNYAGHQSHNNSTPLHQQHQMITNSGGSSHNILKPMGYQPIGIPPSSNNNNRNHNNYLSGGNSHVSTGFGSSVPNSSTNQTEPVGLNNLLLVQQLLSSSLPSAVSAVAAAVDNNSSISNNQNLQNLATLLQLAQKPNNNMESAVQTPSNTTTPSISSTTNNNNNFGLGNFSFGSSIIGSNTPNSVSTTQQGPANFSTGLINFSSSTSNSSTPTIVNGLNKNMSNLSLNTNKFNQFNNSNNSSLFNLHINPTTGRSLMSEPKNLSLSPNSAAFKQQEGPDGCNLFIYHLPAEFGDVELAQTFCTFGNILSAKVFIDKNTNLSKCFGFVSYDNVLSANQAIQAMNGFQIGIKRLKVQLKKSKSQQQQHQMTLNSHNGSIVNNS